MRIVPPQHNIRAIWQQKLQPLPVNTRDQSKQDHTLLVKIAKYIGFLCAP